MPGIIVFTLLFVIFAIWFMAVRIHGYSKKDARLKTVAALCCLGVGVCAYMLHPSLLGGLLLTGGVCGAIGDICLGFSHVSRSHRYVYGKLGFVFFGLGHVFYIVGPVIVYADRLLYWAIPLVVGILLGSAFGVFGKKMGLRFGHYQRFVIFYASLLTTCAGMGISLNVMTRFSVSQLLLFGVGMILFTISDMILSRTYFSSGGKTPMDVITNHVTYYVAQYLILISILWV